MKKTSLALIPILLYMLLAAVAAEAQNRTGIPGKMSSLVRLASLQWSHSGNAEAMRLGGKREPVSLCALVKTAAGSDSPFYENNCVPLAKIGNIYVVDIPLGRIASLSESPSVLRIEASRRHTLTMDTTAVITGVGRLRNGDGLQQAYTGRGVVVGVMDVGFDLTSPNFYDRQLGNTRIRRFWDQLSADSLGSQLYVGADYRSAETILAYAHSHDAQIETHGTHTLGIAAGTGVDTPYGGVAPDADICIVSNAVTTDVPLIPPEQLYKYTSATDVLGFKYIFDYASEIGQPCVISFSEGSTQSFSHDEQLFEEALGLLQGPGRIIVASAGNQGEQRTFQRKPQGKERDGVFYLSEQEQTSLTMTSAQPFVICLSAYTDEGESRQLTIPSESITSAKDSIIEDSVEFYGHMLHYTVQAYQTYFNSRLTAYDFVFSMQGGVGGTQRLAVEAVGSDADVCIYSNGAQFYPSSKNTSISGGQQICSIGSPGCAPSVICVGATAYRTGIKNIDGQWQSYDCGTGGEIADYSSVGPTRDGRVKPDVVANGTHVISSVSSFYQEANPEGSVRDYTVARTQFNGRTYPWAAFLGTSMSTPVVAGTIALWLEANPQLTTADVLDIMENTCRRPDIAANTGTNNDTHPGDVIAQKDNRWGYGEIDAYAGMLRVLGADRIEGLPQSHPRQLSVSYSDGKLLLACHGDSPNTVMLTVYSPQGHTMLERRITLREGKAELSLRSLPCGVYAVKTSGSSLSLSGSFLIRR